MATNYHWSPPNDGWIKLNMDGAVPSNNANASIGSVLSDSNARWLCGCTMLLGKELIFKIEARSVLEGLRIAWDKGFRRIKLECDNVLLVESLLAALYDNGCLHIFHK
ncbi:hypothetical protein J1N35_005315 [Gossypium stocksii]|uniref:RNase H type-1 domain-containing protein n=1 Tax=Gossypium stocksii TaxID=47602 RepID=A0A9D3WF41_9ROSI|nr:hypothetical protein J1N35_005315 [Gossypium stocksii]